MGNAIGTGPKLGAEPVSVETHRSPRSHPAPRMAVEPKQSALDIRNLVYQEKRGGCSVRKREVIFVPFLSGRHDPKDRSNHPKRVAVMPLLSSEQARIDDELRAGDGLDPCEIRTLPA